MPGSGSSLAARWSKARRRRHALIRELAEELGIGIAPPDLTPLTFASHAYPDFHLLMPLYLCRRWQGEVTAHEGQELLWVGPDALGSYAMPPADEPLKALLPSLLSRTEFRHGRLVPAIHVFGCVPAQGRA